VILRVVQEATELTPPSAIITNVQDSAAAIPAPQGATSMPARTGPPDTSYYMKLGYAAAIVIFAAYIGLLLKRVAGTRRSR
jgi:hypothetical protein